GIAQLGPRSVLIAIHAGLSLRGARVPNRGRALWASRHARDAPPECIARARCVVVARAAVRAVSADAADVGARVIVRPLPGIEVTRFTRRTAGIRCATRIGAAGARASGGASDPTRSTRGRIR